MPSGTDESPRAAPVRDGTAFGAGGSRAPISASESPVHDGVRAKLTLGGTEAYDSGVVHLSYRPSE